jgi:hypothetical protein
MNPLRMTGTSSIGDRRIDRGVLGGEVCVRCGTTWLPVNCESGPTAAAAASIGSSASCLTFAHAAGRRRRAAGQPLLQPPPRHSGEGAQRAVLRPKHGR